MHGKQCERRPGLWPLLCSGAELGAYLHRRQPSWLVHEPAQPVLGTLFEPVQPMPADTLRHGQVQASSQMQPHEHSSSSERFNNMVRVSAQFNKVSVESP